MDWAQRDSRASGFLREPYVVVVFAKELIQPALRFNQRIGERNSPTRAPINTAPVDAAEGLVAVYRNPIVE